MSTEELERLLFDCLRARDGAVMREQLKTISDTEWTALLDLSAELMAAPMLRHRLLSPALKPALPDRIGQTLAAEQRSLALANLRIHRDFHRVVVALRERRIPVIALKGLHLLSLVYGDLARRATGDIDLLVPTRDLASAGAVLQDLGYEPLYPYTVSHDPIPYSGKHLPRFVRSGATDVEIHWHITAEPRLSVDIDELWARAVPARVAGVDVQVLSPEDLVLYLCIHATCLHLCAFSVRPWCDIAATLDRYRESLSWDQVTIRATQWRCRRGAYLAFRLAVDLLGAAVPDEVLQALKPAGLDDRILTVAMRQRHGVRMPIPIAQLASQRDPAAKLRALWRVLLPKHALADAYDVPRSSRLVYALYPIWLIDMAKRHWRTAIHVHRGDPALTALAADTMALQKFLAEE